MADFEQPEIPQQQIVNGKVPLGNSYSEFKRVDNAYLHNGSTVGKASHCISTIEELNERIGNLSSALDDFSYYEKGFSDDEEENNSQDALSHLPSNQNQEKERKEVKQFSGMYTCLTVLAKDEDSRHKKQLKFKKVASTITKKPMLVELHSFPGYDKEQLTPLPVQLSTLFIMNVVIDAQAYLKNKRTFRLTFQKFFTSTESQSVFQDSFWWYFCHKYQPCSTSQENLFDRIARNYTKLLFTWSETKFQDKLFKNYDRMIAQAIYATFCHAFPTSYRQFNGEFRDELVSLITLWTMGIRPPPRSWQNWNFSTLEPPGLRKGEKIQEDAAKAEALDLERCLSDTSKDVGADVLSKSTDGNNSEGKKSVDNMIKQISSVLGIVEPTKKKQSCPVGKSAIFSKAVFNVNGRSPLVEYFLAINNLNEQWQTSVYVRRTEIKSFPSSTCETYNDVIEDTIIKGEKTRERFKSSTHSTANERRIFSQKRISDNANFKERASKLLSNPKEVRKISELLKLPEKEEPEEADVRAARLRSLLSHVLAEDEEEL